MKKMKPYIVMILIGVVLICVGQFLKSDYYSDMLFSMGVGIIIADGGHMIRIIYWQNPKRREEYEAKKRETHINYVDERNQYLRMKACHITYQIMTIALLILSLMLALFRVDAWIMIMIFLIFLFQYLTGDIVYRILKRKM